MRKRTKEELRQRLARIEDEYYRAMDEIRRVGDTRFATAEEQRDEVARVYLGTIAALRRQIESRR